MKQDVVGLLLNAADCITHDPAAYRHGLQTLAKNIHEFRKRWMAGDKSVADEFFDLYVTTEARAERKDA